MSASAAISLTASSLRLAAGVRDVFGVCALVGKTNASDRPREREAMLRAWLSIMVLIWLRVALLPGSSVIGEVVSIIYPRHMLSTSKMHKSLENTGVVKGIMSNYLCADI